MDRPEGGVMIDHAYRFTEGLKKAKYSPHFHFIVSGWFDFKKNGQNYKEDINGYIVKYIDSLPTRKNVYTAARYILSHSSAALGQPGERQSEQTLRYFGEYSNNKFGADEILSETDGVVDNVMMALNEHTAEAEIKDVQVRAAAVPEYYQAHEWTYHETTRDPAGVQGMVQRAIEHIRTLKDYPAHAKSRVDGESTTRYWLNFRIKYDNNCLLYTSPSPRD